MIFKDRADLELSSLVYSCSEQETTSNEEKSCEVLKQKVRDLGCPKRAGRKKGQKQAKMTPSNFCSLVQRSMPGQKQVQ